MEAIVNMSLNHDFVTRLVMSNYMNGNVRVEVYMENVRVCELTDDSATILPEGIMAIADTPYTDMFLEVLMQNNIIRCYVPMNNGSRKTYLCGMEKDETVSDYNEKSLVAHYN